VSASRPPAILLGGGVTGLAVARSLSSAGVDVFALGEASDPLRRSRSVRYFAEIAGGADAPERCLTWLERGPREGVVLPCQDDGLELVAHHRAELVDLGYQPIEANDEVLLAMLDKERTYELAREVGIPVPQTAVVTSVEETTAAAAQIGYPCALKPRHSHLFGPHFPGKKAFVVRSEEELWSRLASTEGLGLELIVTEIVRGADDSFVSYYSYLDENGEPLFDVTKRKVRTFPPGFGVGSYHLTEWMPEVAEVGLRFLQGVGVRGLAVPEFKLSSRDGRLTLIECNHRFTMATEQLRACGVDLALFTYNRLVGLPTPTVNSYRAGVGLWFPLRDARAFVRYRRHGELTFGAWVRSLLRPQRFPIASLSDPGPSIGEAVRKAQRAAEILANTIRVRRRRRSGAPP
jgi:D-aspartate ligase